ncbi:hypothetical protein H0H92_006897 [Tricholoma furcatifolium]|nr:hypothetical protein H0H92_006897 [Tricholoma furcatifolium]
MTEIAIENARLHAENEALKNMCGAWRRRAELHGAATLGLFGFARTARDQALRMRYERDEVYKHYLRLRERLSADEISHYPPPPPPSAGVQLPPLPSLPPPIEAQIPPSLSRRPQPMLSVDDESPRPTKRMRTVEPSS